MTIQFQVVPHSRRPGVKVVEILLDGEMVAMIYPDGGKGIKLVSTHMKGVLQDDGTKSLPPIPAVLIEFDSQPYTIEGVKIVKHPQR